MHYIDNTMKTCKKILIFDEWQSFPMKIKLFMNVLANFIVFDPGWGGHQVTKVENHF